MAENIRLTYGMAEITYGGQTVPNFADAASVSLEPILTQIDLYTAPNYDQLLEGWNVSVTVAVDEESYEAYKMALAGVEVTTGADSEEVAIVDGVGMQSLREKAKELVIHPVKDGNDQKHDITIFKAVPTGTVERSYAKDKTQYEITFTGLHRTGDASQIANYFMIGDDPTIGY